MDSSQERTDWKGWYRLARKTLGYTRKEAAEYANLRFVEEQNRAAMRRSTAIPDRRNVA